MKIPSSLSIAAVVLFAASGCDKRPSEIEKKISELERLNQESAARQRELEQQLEDQKIAAERDAIERERARIEEDRAELERRQGQAAAEQDEALRQREEAIAKREGRLEEVRENLEEKENQLGGRDSELSDRERELAGREALDFDTTEQDVPVGDYGTFYDSLSSYGSWYDTADYGYVWQPAVVREENWRPYSRGRWACSDRGWTWVSEEPFGWATYHYGRWAIIGGRGWVWVPGSEWAPCWVSWRESGSHIGWAPLPPETMAYRGRGCDSTVDVRFAIGAICFNFVEIRHFGGPLFRHCLPVAGNGVWFGQTINITHIHFRNRQVICGGPAYQKINGQIGGRIPFYRLEVDHHPRLDRNQLALRPQVRDGKLRVSAPNMDAGWNAGLKPKEVRGRIESVKVERNGAINSEITDRFRQTREEERRRADQTINELGGRERFEEVRGERLRENRIVVEEKFPGKETRVAEKDSAGRNDGRVANEDGLKLPEIAARNPLPEGMTRPSDPKSERLGNDTRKVEPRVVPEPETNVRRETGRQGDGPRVLPNEPEERRGNADASNDNKRRAEQAANAEKENANRRQQEQAEQARQARDEDIRRKQEEQARLEERQERQRQAEQARQQAMEEQREQARQQQAREERRQQQEQERQRQQEEARQREQQESRRQQEQAERQREQEQSRQREQEQARQREQEQSRQREQEQARQQKQKDDDDERNRRNR